MEGDDVGKGKEGGKEGKAKVSVEPGKRIQRNVGKAKVDGTYLY